MSVSDIQNALNLLQDKEVDAAISKLERTVGELPAHLPAHVLLARAYESKRRWQDALRSWENAHFLMPNSPTVLQGRKRVLDRMSDNGTGDDAPATDTIAKEAPPEEDVSPEEEEPSAGEAPPEEDATPETPSAETPSVSAETSPSETTPSAQAPPETPVEEKPAGEPSGDKPSGDESSGDPEAVGETPEEDTREDASEEPAGEAQSEERDAPQRSDRSTPAASKAMSELEQLRQRAEAEARQGGARPGMQQPSSREDDGDDSDAGDSTGTPEERVDEVEDEVTGDLDRLIRELESARIEPRPQPDDPSAEADEYPEPNLEDDDVDDLVSETLARIYAGQGQYQEAARIYVKLASQEPSRARYHLQNAAEMREKAEGDA